MPGEVPDAGGHRCHEAGVVARWGREAWDSGDRWWRCLSGEDQRASRREQADIARGSGAATAAGRAPHDDEVQALAARQVAWLGRTGPATAGRVTALGALYVEDPRFAEHYDRHGAGAAVLVRDALAAHAARHLDG